jgi:hydroxyacylglutathione hydrolase
VLFRQFVDDDLGCASYLVGDPEAGTAVVVDPAFAIEQYVTAAADEDVRIERVLETHTHADHLSGHGRFALEHDVPVAISPVAGVEYPHDPLNGGDVVDVGAVRVRVLPTPGHRPEHCAFVVDEQLVLTGDSLFIGDAARPDLAVPAREGAEDLFHSLAAIVELPEDVSVYPGHVAGSLCGVNMSSERSSTIGQERRANHALAYRDLQEFVLASASVSTPRPPTTEQVVALNSGRWVARPPDPEEVDGPDGATVLDVRPFDDYTAGHVPGAISVPALGGSFGTKAGFVLLPDEHVVLHARTAAEARTAAGMLWAVGILGPLGYVVDAPAEETLATVDLDDLKRLLDSDAVQVVDVREHAERDAGYLPGSRNIPYRLIRKIGCDALDRAKPVVTLCESGPRAAIAASLLKREGFDARAVVGGGIADFADEMVSFRRCGGS